MLKSPLSGHVPRVRPTSEYMVHDSVFIISIILGSMIAVFLYSQHPMSWSRSANRQLLWSILRASGQSLSSRTQTSHVAGRYFCKSSARCGFADSGFSFGEEGDQVIVGLKRRKVRDGDVEDTNVANRREETEKKGMNEKEDTPAIHSETAVDASLPDIGTPVATFVSKKQVREGTGNSRSREPPASSEGFNLFAPETATKPSRPRSRERLAAEKKTAKSKRKTRDETPTRSRGPLAEFARTQSRRSTSTSTATAPAPKDPVKEEAAARLEAARANPNLPSWAVQKLALAAKFGSEGWNPRRKLSPDAMLGIRTLHQDDPTTFTTPVLAKQFKISPEAIRRILKSKWLPKAGPEKAQEMRERWAKRHDRIWDTKSELGLRPKREEGGERRARDASEGAEEVEHVIWAEETLDRARREDPLVQKRFQRKADS
jgi:hypothetical protein